MEGSYKIKILNNLIITCSMNTSASLVNDFVYRVISYKSNLDKIINTHSIDNRCPMLLICKALFYLDKHSFKLDEKISQLTNMVATSCEELKNANIELESWEKNWVDILSAINSGEKILDICFKNAKENPNDLLCFKFAMVICLYSGDKESMKKLADLYYNYHENHHDGNFIGIYSFILQELRLFEESELWVRKGLDIDPENIWIQHNYSHILYQTNRIEDSISYLESKKHTWRHNCSNFLFKHIHWHLSVAYLEMADYKKSDEYIDIIVNHEIEGAECALNILGYILRFYIRSDGFINIKGSHCKWIDKLICYITRMEIYTKHLLFDCLTIWLLSYLNNINYIMKDVVITELLTSIYCQINDNINNSNDKDFLKTNYINLLKAMEMFGCSNYSEALQLFLINEASLHKFGGSDEQLLVLIEAELYAACKCNNNSSDSFDNILERYKHKLYYTQFKK